MITDIIKNKGYRHYRTVTFISDWTLVQLALICAILIIIIIGCVLMSFATWENYFIIVLDMVDGYYWLGLRISIITSSIVAVFVNSKSHAKEIEKLNAKK